MRQTYQPSTPDVRDGHARTLLWILLVITIVNVAMCGYTFLVVHHAVVTLQHLGDAFSHLGDTPDDTLTP